MTNAPLPRFSALLAASLLAAALPATAGSATDAWDVSQGTAVTAFVANPGLPGNGPGMFGGDAGATSPFAVERFNTIFPDLLPVGTVHLIEWATPAPIALTGWQLDAAADGTGGRAFSHFTLLADVAGAWVPLADLDTLAAYDADYQLLLSGSFAAVTAQRFRAEFTQATSFFGASGPRVVELDAVTATVPEPGSWALLLGGLAVLARRRRVARRAGLTALAMAPLLASAQSFDAAGDFSSAANPTGTWAYGSAAALGSDITVYDTASTAFQGASSWNAGTFSFPGMYPLVFHNGTATAINYGAGAIAPGELGLHPGQDGRLSVVRWTAPQAGSFRVDALFTRDDIGATDVHVLGNLLELQGASLDAAHLSWSFTRTVALAAGDRLDFAVGFGADAVFLGDTVDLSVQITAVPEPAGWALMLLGAGGLIARRKAVPPAQV